MNCSWKKADENPDSVRVEDGKIVTNGPRCHLFYDGDAEPFVNFIESLDENQWSLLVENVPEAIASADPLGFGRFDDVTPDDLRLILNNI